MKLWSSQLWAQFLQLRREAWKIQDFNRVWTRDLAIPVRRSNQLSAMKPLTLGAGHLWVLMVSWGMNQWWNGIWNESYVNCRYEIKWSYDLRSYERNFTTAKIIASLDFISAVHIWFISYTISSFIYIILVKVTVHLTITSQNYNCCWVRQFLRQHYCIFQMSTVHMVEMWSHQYQTP